MLTKKDKKIELTYSNGEIKIVEDYGLLWALSRTGVNPQDITKAKLLEDSE